MRLYKFSSNHVMIDTEIRGFIHHFVEIIGGITTNKRYLCKRMKEIRFVYRSDESIYLYK